MGNSAATSDSAARGADRDQLPASCGGVPPQTGQPGSQVLCVLTITNLAGDALEMAVPSDMTVRALKGRIFTSAWAVPVVEQRLVCSDSRQPSDDDRLESLSHPGMEDVARASIFLTLVRETMITGPLGASIDPACYYHIMPGCHVGLLGVAFVEGFPDGSPGLSHYRPVVASKEALGKGAFAWRLQPRANSFALSTPDGGERYALDLTNPGLVPCLRQWGGYTGQQWEFEEAEGGGYILRTKFTPNLCLTYDPDSESLTMQQAQRPQAQALQVWFVKACSDGSA